MKTDFPKNNIIGISSFAVFIFYLTTMAPSVVQIDSGELAAVQATLGISHPTGYPLFTLLGYLFLLLPLPVSVITQLNLLSAVFVSISVYFFMKSIHVSINNTIKKNHDKAETPKGVKRKRTGSVDIVRKKSIFIDEFNSKIIAVISGFALAFSRTFGLQSTSVEVYSLHIFLISVIIYILIRLLNESRTVELKQWLMASILLALSFANHMTTLLIIPGLAYVFFTKEKFGEKSFTKIFQMLSVFVPLLVLIYSYLPLRASLSPRLNWGNPVNFENFVRHFTGKQYQVWIFSSFDSAKKQLAYFFNSLPNEFFMPILFITFLGCIFLIKQNRQLFIFLLICFLTTVFYSINYDINDIDSYFLLAYLVIAFCFPFGLLFILRLLPDKKKYYNLVIIIFFIITATHSAINYKKVDQSGLLIFEDYTKAILNSTELNSIIFSYQWDYFISASYYFQFVENYRADAAVVDKELLRRSWYYHQLNRNYPDIFYGFENDVTEFLKALAPFEQSEKYDPNKLEFYFRKIMTNLVAFNSVNKNFYIAPEIFENEMRRGEFSLPDGYYLAPYQLLFKVVNNNDYLEAPVPDAKIRFPEYGNKYTDSIRRLIASMYAYRAAYEMQHNKFNQARIYVEKLTLEFPEFSLPVSLKRLIE